jgi:hypothetical protein
VDATTTYWKNIRTQFHRLPVWLPGTAMALGDVGILEPGGWTLIANIRELGMSFDALEEPVATEYSYFHNSEVTASGSLDVAAPLSELVGAAEGNFNVSFKSRGAFILKASNVQVLRISNLLDVEKQVLTLRRRADWADRWIICTEVAQGGPAMTLVASDGGATASIGLSGGVAGVGDVSGGLGLQAQSGLRAGFVTPARTAVLWRGHYLSTPFMARAALRERGSSAPDRPGSANAEAEELDGAYLAELAELDEA